MYGDNLRPHRPYGTMEALKESIHSHFQEFNDLDICSTNVYEKKLCECLGEKFQHTSSKYYDAVFENIELEFKKQSSGQWFDLKKMADMKVEESNIVIVWLIHKDKKFVDVRLNTYEDVILFLDEILEDGWKDWAKSAPRKAEIKFPISLKKIKEITYSLF
jgi:hypothetical protein